MQTQKCSCLIPFYNEGDRLLYTLEKLSSIKELKEIICIDDGSADNASKLAKEKFPNINVIVLPHNQGKSAAIFKGLLSVTTEYVLLFDADLQEIKVEEIQNAIQGIENHRSVDMIILRRVVERKLLSFLRHYVVMSGQRILRTKDLIEVAKMKPEKYALETAINKYMMKNNKIVYWMPITTTNIHQMTKLGYKQMVRIILNGFHGYFSSVGIIGYLRQIFTFCKKELV